MPEEIRAYVRHTLHYVKAPARPLVLQVLLAVLLMLAFHTLSARARKRLAAQAGTARLLERPYAIGLLLALLASPALHPQALRQLMQLLSLIALFPAARILIHACGRADPITFTGLLVLFLFDRIGLTFASLPALARTTFLLTLVIGLLIMFHKSAR